MRLTQCPAIYCGLRTPQLVAYDRWLRECREYGERVRATEKRLRDDAKARRLMPVKERA